MKKAIFSLALLAFFAQPIIASTPENQDTLVCGRIYPDRLEDLCWENDVAGFRAYGPGTQRAGERLYGYDLFLKRGTDKPVIAQLIKTNNDPAVWRRVDELRKAGKDADAEEFIKTFSYHVDHGFGMDCYAVGPTLGACTAAIVEDGEIVYPWVYERAVIIENGPERFRAELTFPPIKVGNDLVTEKRLISLDKGSNLNCTTVSYEGLKHTVQIATGIVLHDDGPTAMSRDERFIAYQDPTQGNDNGELYLGAVFAERPDSVGVRHDGNIRHLMAYHTLRPGESHSYYWGFGWNRGNMPSWKAWNEYLRRFSAEHAQIEIVYKNPVIHADYSDPDVCAVGADYYMTASSFNCTPGLPILHSPDLVHWTTIGYALDEVVPTDFFDKPQHGKGVWAPSIRHHNGEFYIYWGDPDFGIYMVKSRRPDRGWSKPVLVKAGKGMIDPTPLWDDDGRVYLVHAWAASRAKFNSVLSICELNQEGTAVISNPVIVYDGNADGNHTVEGPKLYKRNGFYYILAPAGGVVEGWQIALRSKNIYGPYEVKTVMAQGNALTNGPHQGAWVSTEQGEDWFIHFQDKGAYGRIIHLQPVAWREDWPVIGADADGDGCGEPVSQYLMPRVGEGTTHFEPYQNPMGEAMEWHANYKDEFGMPTAMGFSRVYGHILSEDFKNFWEVPNLLLTKFPAEKFTHTAHLKVTARADGQQSGLIVMGWDYCRIAIEKQGEGFVMKQITCNDAEQGSAEKTLAIKQLPYSKKTEAGLLPNYEREIWLRVEVAENAICQFSYSLDGHQFNPFGQSFKARQGKWIGAKTGIFSVAPHDKDRGWADLHRWITEIK